MSLLAAILFCGLTFTSIANLAGVFNLAVFSERYFYRLQNQYLCSVAMEKEGLRCCLDRLLTQGITITSIATDRHTGVVMKEYSFVDHQYDAWHEAKGITKELSKRLKQSIVANSTHGSSPFLTTYGELHKPVIMVHSFLLRNGNILYITFPMYMNGIVIPKHCP